MEKKDFGELEKCGIHIIDTDEVLTEAEIRKPWGLNHKIDTAAKHNIEKYENTAFCFLIICQSLRLRS